MCKERCVRKGEWGRESRKCMVSVWFSLVWGRVREGEWGRVGCCEYVEVVEVDAWLIDDWGG